MINIKKQFIYIIAIVIAVVAVAIGTVIVLKISNNNTTSNTQTKSAITLGTADTLMKSSASTNDPVKAKEILLQARQQYVEINNQDRIQAVDAMILMIDNTPKK